LQDFLSLDSSARINYPGRSAGNWSWRFQAKDLTADLEKSIFDLNRTYGRGNYKKFDSVQNAPQEADEED
jgi:4-alpha-glucanotransferase